MAADELFSPLPKAVDVVGEATTKELIVQLHTLWVMPEVARRRAAGLLAPGEKLALFAYQIIFRDGETEVRFNQKTRGRLGLATDAPAEGTEHKLSEVMHTAEHFELYDDEIDCAHVTMLRLHNDHAEWAFFFNPMRNRALVRQFVEHARAFLGVARLSYEQNLVGPCVDCLYSACELTCKAHLLLVADPAGKAEAHKAIRSASNLARKMGRIPSKFVDLFNHLTELRKVARYSVGHRDMLGVVQADVDMVAAELDWLAERCVPRDA